MDSIGSDSQVNILNRDKVLEHIENDDIIEAFYQNVTWPECDKMFTSQTG